MEYIFSRNEIQLFRDVYIYEKLLEFAVRNFYLIILKGGNNFVSLPRKDNVVNNEAVIGRH